MMQEWSTRKRDGKLCDYCGTRTAAWMDGFGGLSCNRCRTERFHNGAAEWVTVGDDGLWRDSAGRTGYASWFAGTWVCYTCGALCDEDVHDMAVSS